MNSKYVYRKKKPQTYLLVRESYLKFTSRFDIPTQRIYLADEANAYMNQQEKELEKLRQDARNKGFITTEQYGEMEKRALDSEAKTRYLEAKYEKI